MTNLSFTSIQRFRGNCFRKSNSLVGKNCQIWVATHSIGFLRALQEDLSDDCQIIDFGSGVEFATSSHVLTPMAKSRNNWSRIFETALDDLTGLVSPKRIIYCEGRADTKAGEENGLDANIYNTVFGETFPDTLFVSSGGNTEPQQRMEIAISILGKVFSDVEILVLIDRDFGSGAETSQKDRETYLANNPSYHRVLERWEIENYLYDKAVLKRYCEGEMLKFDEVKYDSFINDIRDCNVKDMTGEIKKVCGIVGNINPEKFKLNLAKYITPGTRMYDELKGCIFYRG